MTFNKKLIASSIMTTFLATGVMAGTNDSPSHKRSTEQYWNEFTQDSKQTWNNTQSAFRDGWIEGKLETALIMNKHLSAFDIDINVDKNVAKLSGEVSTGVEKELAELVAMGIEGIDSVENSLEIKKNHKEKEAGEMNRSFTQYMNDVSTSAEIKTKLLRSSNVSGTDINVDVNRGKVVLAGEVNTKAEKALAEKISQQVTGVESVTNKLEVDS